jgi:hypothetical protein
VMGKLPLVAVVMQVCGRQLRVVGLVGTEHGQRLLRAGALPNPLPIEALSRRHSTAGHEKTPSERGFLGCRGGDSNSRHADYDSAALTTELPRRGDKS